jgi:hypothetical protein
LVIKVTPAKSQSQFYFNKKPPELISDGWHVAKSGIA